MIPNGRAQRVRSVNVNGDADFRWSEAPHDILRLRGVYAVTRYIANEVS